MILMDEWNPAHVKITTHPHDSHHFHWQCSGGPDCCSSNGETFTYNEVIAVADWHLRTRHGVIR